MRFAFLFAGVFVSSCAELICLSVDTRSITHHTALVGKFVFVYCRLYMVNAISNRNMLLSDLQHVRRLAERRRIP